MQKYLRKTKSNPRKDKNVKDKIIELERLKYLLMQIKTDKEVQRVYERKDNYGKF